MRGGLFVPISFTGISARFKSVSEDFKLELTEPQIECEYSNTSLSDCRRIIINACIYVATASLICMHVDITSIFISI